MYLLEFLDGFFLTPSKNCFNENGVRSSHPISFICKPISEAYLRRISFFVALNSADFKR
jgi:hypothetical protein